MVKLLTCILRTFPTLNFLIPTSSGHFWAIIHQLKQIFPYINRRNAFVICVVLALRHCTSLFIVVSIEWGWFRWRETRNFDGHSPPVWYAPRAYCTNDPTAQLKEEDDEQGYFIRTIIVDLMKINYRKVAIKDWSLPFMVIV